MSRPFESFDFLNRGWDVRALENASLRSIFLWLLLGLFVLGMDASMGLYIFVHQHRFNPVPVAVFVLWAFVMFRYGRIIYRRHER